MLADAQAQQVAAQSPIEGVVYDLDRPITLKRVQTLHLPQLHLSATLPADVNGDTLTDLCLWDSSAGVLHLVVSGPDEATISRIDLPELMGAKLLEAGTLTSSGCSDLVFAGKEHRLTIARSNCSGGFTSHLQEVAIAPERETCTLLDSDADGIQELLVVEQAAHQFHLYRLSPEHRLTSITLDVRAESLELSKYTVKKLMAGDFNGDTRDDLLWILDHTNGSTGLAVTLASPAPPFASEWLKFPVSGNYFGLAITLYDPAGQGRHAVLQQYASRVVLQPLTDDIPASSWMEWGAFADIELIGLEPVQASDLNGDDIDDLVTRLPLGNGWRALISFGTNGVRTELKSPLGQVQRYWVGSFPGGAALAALTNDNQLVLLAPEPAVAASLAMKIEGVGSFVTGTDGRFSVSLPPARASAPAVMSAKHRVFPSQLVSAVSRKPPLVLSVTQTPYPPAESRFGRGICNGYHSGNEDPWGPQARDCQKGAVVIEMQDGARPRFICCDVLPPDLLTNEHVVVDTQCPGDTVVTGTGKDCFFAPCENTLRCTKINTQRYRLGPPQLGIYWGKGHSGPWLQVERIFRYQMPVSLRFAMGRETPKFASRDGCIGPHETVLVARDGKRCSDAQFARILYQGAPGDPPAGTPVPLYAPCSLLSDVTKPYPQCLR